MRCMIRLLGILAAYNYVMCPWHDFDHCRVRIRGLLIVLEGVKVYRPQFFKELSDGRTVRANTIKFNRSYIRGAFSIVAQRIKSSGNRKKVY